MTVTSCRARTWRYWALWPDTSALRSRTPSSAIRNGAKQIPFAEKQTLNFHDPIRFDRFLPATSKVSGRIVMGKDFDSELGTGHKVYINVGANQGVKIGDYFRAVRLYDADLKSPVDSLSFKAALAEDSQKKTPSVDPAMFPKATVP